MEIGRLRLTSEGKKSGEWFHRLGQGHCSRLEYCPSQSFPPSLSVSSSYLCTPTADGEHVFIDRHFFTAASPYCIDITRIPS